MSQKNIAQLEAELIRTKVDYLDNKGSSEAGAFYADYFRAYNAYMAVTDPSKVKKNWQGD
jgi:hypothetical protein